jgi:hypothetical protein
MDARESAYFLTREEGFLTHLAFHAGFDQVWRCGKSREGSKNLAGRHDLKPRKGYRRRMEEAKRRVMRFLLR